MRIVFAGGGTGGHLYPGLAIARALVRLDPSARPFFVGARRGIERDVLPGTEFPHALLDLHPLYRSRPWENWKTLRGLVGAWRAIGALVREERPRVVVGTGGYASGAMLAYAAVRGIPYVQQTADAFPGLTARLFARRAREIYLGFPEAKPHFPAGPRTEFVDTGNPIEPPPRPRPDRAAARAKWGLPPVGGTVLLVFGGSQGAQAINRAVAEWVRGGVGEGLYVIWGTGKNNYEEFRDLEGPGVRVLPYLSPISDAYAASDLALVRAGAITSAELAAWEIPALFVPLPTAAQDHQTKNAEALAAAGAAVHLRQSELTAASLAAAVRALAGDRARLSAMRERLAARARPDAAQRIAERILALAKRGA
ncbi:MAG: UDP-N-acetylglucosamine--N-acetylmuramyl-(pentapeptide) pyrophosphoryl-undecaprenol N-acetylglucosamine transferase [Gemmatimonadaceae bacterium]